MKASIRKAGREDLEVLLDLMTEFYAESAYDLHQERARRAFDQLLGDVSLGQVWLMQQAGQPAGYIVLTLGFSMEFGGRDAFVDDLFVRPAFRGKGLGRAALEVLFEECRLRGVQAVHLEVDEKNNVARSLYARFGFRDNKRLLWSRPLADPVHEI